MVVLWKIGDRHVKDPVIKSRGIDADTPSPDPKTGIRTITLSVPATVVNNGTSVRCEAYTNKSTVQSPTVTLLVQGMQKKFLSTHSNSRNIVHILTLSYPFFQDCWHLHLILVSARTMTHIRFSPGILHSHWILLTSTLTSHIVSAAMSPTLHV